MKSPTQAVEAKIYAPLEKVFAEFSNFETFPKNFHDATSQITSTNRTGLHTQWKQQEHAGDENIDSIYEVIEFRQNELIRMTSDDPRSLDTLSFHFSQDGDETDVVFELIVEPKGFANKVLIALLKGSLKGIMMEEMNRMKAHLESNA